MCRRFVYIIWFSFLPSYFYVAPAKIIHCVRNNFDIWCVLLFFTFCHFDVKILLVFMCITRLFCEFFKFIVYFVHVFIFISLLIIYSKIDKDYLFEHQIKDLLDKSDYTYDCIASDPKFHCINDWWVSFFLSMVL